MNTPRILIAEDEPLIRSEIIRLLNIHWPQATIVAEAEDGAEAIDLWGQYKPDVALLDIQMPGITGLEAARMIHAQAKGATQIVFITAFNEHALAAFDAGAVDYLLKPLNEVRLKDAIKRIEQRRQISDTAPGDLNAVLSQLTALVGKPQTKEPLKWISASVGNQIKLITIDEVVFFQSDNKYTRVVLPTSDAFIRKPLRELADELDAKQFKQVHRGTVVNMNAVASVTRDGTGRGTIKFKQHKETVDVSAAYMEVFRAL
jgi:DNA-binding LytR/AlgR family response regulator